MKASRSFLYIIGVFIIAAALYRIIPGRPYGFAPQIAMALFAGAIVRNKIAAFVIPVLSMLVSDALFELLHVAGISPMWGFYEGQVTNYVLFALLTTIGFFITKINITRVAAASITAPTVYFLLSNFVVWISGGGFNRPKTVTGLLMSYTDGMPFYLNSIAGTLFFSGLFFVGYHVVKNHILKPEIAR